ncbi:AMP-binding protein [Nocardia sp. CDC159]|uniref:AMP-binding protein n=1 Tax=Nocardia pulmonis TaxID=2951408 RepID=A0A9X2J008_9NOCA|nr:MULTISPECIES: AMP-binding protein [Nocardia]MCM6776620.1 AMP-binding protein [Nocardia pulmonis]MCM6789231.1 AMP-binding protein [Nocardia sp. CDC159]
MTARPYARGELIHELFRRCAAERPEAIALIHDGRRIGYRELDTAAGIFAAELRGLGVGPGTVVPVIMPRSARLVVALLAVLECGAAYSAFDPRWPDERIRDLLGLLAPPVVISDELLRAGGVPTCRVPESGAVTLSRPDAPAVEVTGTSPCAVFFTSGTTGKPKGVVSPHRGTVRLFGDCPFARFGPETVMPLAAAVPWDAFGLELWSVLMNGGCSVIIDEPYLTPGALRAGVERYGVDTVSLTASVFAMFVDEDLDCFTGIGQLFVGAERVSPEHVRRFVERHPAIRLVHCYGPAESTIFATTYRVTAGDRLRENGIPLGLPVPNTGVHLWDDGEVLEPGRRGEIVLTGDGLALGYLADPEQTAARFVPLHLDGAQRLAYRTGDVGYRDADGLLYFDGRVDRQVKIRGHRVEPAEIERTAAELPWLGRCAAVPLPDPAGGYRGLALFYRGEHPDGDTARRLRAHLENRLPGYLVPRLLQAVADFPWNDNGKLDSAALLSRIDRSAIEPVWPDERTTRLPFVAEVAAAFGSVLGMRTVPHEVSFVALGGDSLGLGRLATRLSARLSLPVPLSILTRYPTVVELAHWLTTAAPAADGKCAVETADRVPLSPIQAFFEARHRADPASPAYHCLMVWRIDGPVERSVLTDAMIDLHLRHEPLRAAYRHLGADPVAVLPDPPPPVRLIDLRRIPDATAAETELLAVLTAPLDLAAGLIWRAAIVDVGADCLLGVAVHHVAFDGWSEAVLAKELGDCYAARSGRAAPCFDAATATLAELESERRRQLALADLATQRAYWRNTLRDIPFLDFPAPRSAVPSGPVGVRARRIGAAGMRRVDRLAAHHRSTRFTVLFACYAWALHTVTGRSDFGIGVPIVKRETPIRQRAIGCFIDMIIVRVRLAGADDRDGAIAALHTAVQDALSGQDVPFLELSAMAPRPESGRTSPHQTMFALQNNERPALTLPGRTAEFRRMPRQRAPFELITEVWPQCDGSAMVEFTYQSERVATEFVDRVGRHFFDAIGE